MIVTERSPGGAQFISTDLAWVNAGEEPGTKSKGSVSVLVLTPQ